MKKNKVLSLLLICSLMLSGCNLIKEETTNGKTIIPEYTDKINCSILKDVKMVINQDSINTIVLTNDGELYRLGKYSDGTNCKKIEHNFDIKIIFNQDGLYGEDGKFYKIEDNNIIESNDFFYEEALLELMKNVDDIIKVSRDFNSDYDNKNGIPYYVLKSDGNLYKIIVSMHEDKYQFSEELFKSYPDEKIIDIGISYFDELKYIKTDKSYYINKVKDERCYDYDDIKCDYDLVKDDFFTKKYNDISFLYECTGGHYGCNYILKNGKKYEDHIGG